MSNINQEEQKYFDYTMDSLRQEIAYYKKEMEEIPKRHTKALQGDAFLVESLMSIAATKIRRLELSENSPYFGRIDFLADETNNLAKIYIGKTNISGDDGKQVVTDWRAPICSLYYDSDLGRVSYDAPIGKVTGDLKLKRQIIIKNGKLTEVLDTNIVSEDELLFPYLNVNADNKMKTIIASVQKEQNQIIRKPFSNNIIVQGVAGSGKTSVALHRIAYLIYNLQDKIKANQFMILGPNKFFLEYISYILPELDTEPVNQETYFELVKDMLGEKLVFVDENESFFLKNSNPLLFKKIQNFKSSLECKNALDIFMREYVSNDIVLEGIMMDGEEVYSRDAVYKALFSNVNQYPNFEYACKYFVENFKNNMERIYNNLNQKYRKVYTSGLSKDDPVRKQAVEKSEELAKMIKKDGIKLIKDYFKKIHVSTLNIYKLFIENLDKYTNSLTEDEMINLKEISLQAIKQKKVCFSDLPSLLYINNILCNKMVDYKHIVIDEAQDYGIFHFYALKKLYPNCTFSIYGDLAQSIYSYRSVNDWESVINNVFSGECEMLNLNKSYRTTSEITYNANKILNQIHLNTATPVIRHGSDIVFSKNAKDINYKINRIKEFIGKGYKTIAIICKTEKESLNVYKDLLNNNINAVHIAEGETEYNGQIIVLTSSLSKGLEFDAVIINDASNNVYSVDSKPDMHLLYVASTRALHELEILYDKQLCPVFGDVCEKTADNVSKHMVRK